MKRVVAMIVAVMMLSGALLIGCSSAGGSYKDGAWYKSLDKDHDGNVTKAEEKNQAPGM